MGQETNRPRAIVLDSPSLQLVLDPVHGGVVHLRDKASGLDWIGGAPLTNYLWQIDLSPGQRPARITPFLARKFRWEFPSPNRQELRLVWEDFRMPLLRALRVEASVRMDLETPQCYWSIQIQKPRWLHLQRLRFPRIPEITRQPAERLAVPAWMGQLTKTPRRLIAGGANSAHRLEWSYPGALSLQCLAFYRENGPGLYLACDDTAAYRKAFAFWGAENRPIGCEMVHSPENEARAQTQYALPYHAVVGTFSGDWFTAAERYRRWGTNQLWAVGSRLNQGQVPEWLQQTALWIWNRGRSPGVIGPALNLAHELKLPVSVFWHWWHGCAYDAGFPEYLPPREGATDFQAALTKAHENGLHAMVYMNQRLWGTSTRSWRKQGAKRYAVKGVDGKVKPEIYNTYTQQACASMCLATPFWRGTYAALAETVVNEFGVDGLYMDQACSNLLCYDPTHGHPLDGGNYWFNGCRLLTQDIRHRIWPKQNILLAGEGVGEAWLPWLDLMLALQVSRERYATPKDGWECIPFFQAVYHAYGITYGNYSSLTIPPYDELWPARFAPKEPLKLLDRKFSTQFYVEQARTFAWGSQPMLANYLPAQRRQRTEEIAYLLRLARLRQLATKYLLFGTSLRPPAVPAPPVTFPVSHLSIYAGRKGKGKGKREKGEVSHLSIQAGDKNTAGVKKISTAAPSRTKGRAAHEATQTQGSSPPLICGAWQAKDGDIAIAIVNITSGGVPFTANASQYGFAKGDRVTLIGDKGRTELGRLSDDRALTLEIPSRSAVILEFRRSSLH